LVDTLGFLAHLAAIVELHKETLLEPIVYHLLDFCVAFHVRVKVVLHLLFLDLARFKICFVDLRPSISHFLHNCPLIQLGVLLLLHYFSADVLKQLEIFLVFSFLFS